LTFVKRYDIVSVGRDSTMIETILLIGEIILLALAIISGIANLLME